NVTFGYFGIRGVVHFEDISKPDSLFFNADPNAFNMLELADGCADLSVVTTGTLSACGIADKALLEEVDRNNIAKFRDGVKKREDGKVLKPEGHQPPDIRRVLIGQGWGIENP